MYHTRGVRVPRCLVPPSRSPLKRRVVLLAPSLPCEKPAKSPREAREKPARSPRKARRQRDTGLLACDENENKSGSVEIVLQAAAAAGVAQLAQGLRLDLANALARDPELPAHLLQRPAAAVLQAKAEPQHVL